MPAAGTWYPVVMKDGKDVLLTSAADKAAFVPQIDVAHQMYNNIWEPKHPSWMSNSYLENKRTNARILRDKGVAKYRMYECRERSTGKLRGISVYTQSDFLFPHTAFLVDWMLPENDDAMTSESRPT